MPEDIASTQTATGNPLTLQNCAPINAESLQVEFNPKQDLHGYDYPWVGGAGKNLCDPSKKSVYSSTIWRWYESDGYLLSANQAYTFSCSGDVSYLYFIDKSTGNALAQGSANDKKVTYTPTADTLVYFQAYKTSALSDMDVQLEKGSTATNIVPWSNICSITGYTGMSVGDVGFNIWDEEKLAGYYDASGNFVASNSNVCSKNIIDVMPNETYFFYNVQYAITSHSQGRFCYYDANGNFLYRTDLLYIGNNEFTIPSGCYGIKFHADGDLTYKFCINISKTEGTPKNGNYLPYQSTSASISFGQTVYGGKSDFKNGGTDDDRLLIDLGGRTYTKAADGYFYCNISDLSIKDFNKSNKTAICEVYKLCNYAEWSGRSVDSAIVGVAASHVLYVADSRFTDANDLKTALNGVMLCATLNTASTISTPPTPLPMLKGINNLASEGNSTIEIGYQPDNVIGELKEEMESHLAMPYLRILDNNVDTAVNDYQIHFHMIASAFTLVNMAEMLSHRFIFVELVQNPSGTANHNLLHSALIDPRTIDGFSYEMKASGNDKVVIKSDLAQGKFSLYLQTTSSYSEGDATDYYVTIRLVD